MPTIRIPSPLRRYTEGQNQDEIRTLKGADSPVSDQDEISIVPAMAGGHLG
jgi:molybdopterin converting factor small subunit